MVEASVSCLTSFIEGEPSLFEGDDGIEAIRREVDKSFPEFSAVVSKAFDPFDGGLGSTCEFDRLKEAWTKRRCLMRLLRYTAIWEPDGWMHGVEVEVRPGALLLLVDDTRSVSAAYREGGGEVTKEEAVEAWGRFGLGSSGFPVNVGDAEDCGNEYAHDISWCGWEGAVYLFQGVDSEAMLG